MLLLGLLAWFGLYKLAATITGLMLADYDEQLVEGIETEDAT